jgi:tRNA-Thr(GGU) m(6)t(6)A37 methyltransferase TsaA
MEFKFEPIGIIHSCYKEKFGIPRQAGLVPEARAELDILPTYAREEAFRGLEGFSHVWILFVFHAAMREQWSPTVRPPKLGGNRRVGVFASRSPFRPNPVGLSVVQLERIEKGTKSIKLILKGGDFLDGTPVLDVKPYVTTADSIPAATMGFADDIWKAEPLEVEFIPSVMDLLRVAEGCHPGFAELVRQILAQDPRPGYYTDAAAGRSQGIRLYGFDVKWTWHDGRIMVTGIDLVS